MNTIQEFKAFAMRGNVIDLSVGVVIGSAFGKIVSSLVSDVITPPLGLIIHNVNFTDIKFHLSDTVTLNIGNFIQATFEFLIIAFAVFLCVKGISMLKREEKKATPTPASVPEEVLLLREIRDALRK